MKSLLCLTLLLASGIACAGESLQLNDKGYFSRPGIDVTVFADIYPDGHQTGVTVIQQGVRTAANGDLRLEVSPGQWSPVPKSLGDVMVDREHRRITQALAYPDESKDRKGFNPIDYPDLKFQYRVEVQALEGDSFRVRVNLDKPLPQAWVGRVGFNFELFPGALFGKSYLMDKRGGIFPSQPNGPLQQVNGQFLAAPLARGKSLVVAPESEGQRLRIERVKGGELELWDGRSNHNNGWFIVRAQVPAGATDGAIEWVVTPHARDDWRSAPVIQVSQLGYGPEQDKVAVIEQDRRDTQADPIELLRLGADGAETVARGKPQDWGEFLRYHYFRYDFSSLRTPGLYQIAYRGRKSKPFRIGSDVFTRHAWQPTLEYYLPVQMCHMRVSEKYRVWHDRCHEDDALMSPVNHNHFDGYISGPSTLTDFRPGQRVPGLNRGGWHDAGDYDLRVESQAGTIWRLALMVEEFGLDYDATAIDEQKQQVEIHRADGRNDALQQIEHGLLSVLGGYRAMGRLYRGIIAPTVPQYVLLGDASAQTDGATGNATADADDRWVFTEENPNRELQVCAGLAAASRVLRDYDSDLAKESLAAAEALFDAAYSNSDNSGARALALAELILASGESRYIDRLAAARDEWLTHIDDTAWAIGRVIKQVENPQFAATIGEAVAANQRKVREHAAQTPYGVPYEPYIWGAGWGIQEFGLRQYFLHRTWPEVVGTDGYVNALNFVLGVHPGSNTESFASGVGADSATVAYGANRADWSYIPGGVISGTALIRPDLPELKTWPYFWQQTEYVMGGGATNYMFLVLAVDSLNRGRK